MATKRTTKKVTDTVAKAAKNTAAKVEAVIPAAEAVVKDTTAKVSAAAEPVVKEAAAKAESVKEAAAESVKEAAAAVKKAAARKTAAKKEAAGAEVYVQYLGREFPVADVVANVKKIWTDEMGKKESDICGLKVYVKPEENKAYYVINGDVTGSMEL